MKTVKKKGEWQICVIDHSVLLQRTRTETKRAATFWLHVQSEVLAYPFQTCTHQMKTTPAFLKENTALFNHLGFIIVGGDVNCVLNQKLDKHPFEYRPKLQKTKVLCIMIEEMGLVDRWHQKHRA